MRETYHEELDSVINDLVSMTDLVQVAVKDSTQALLQADLGIAEQVISNDAKIDAMHDDLEQRCFILLARQAPVAGELRTVVAAMRMTFELARMGDLSAHIAKIARLRYPEKALPADLEANFTRMSELAGEMITTANATLTDRDTEAALTLADEDEEMDALRRDQFKVLLSDDWNHGVEKAVDAALLGRYYERIADHAVALGRRIIYIITGEAPEGENWPNTF
ncbi:phosphate signaling complex protein PhoU [Propionibacteriaceae bacterium Y1923]|uniref:phosphate signaling complex protein PhoU n=1 Tax=Aestuariimicrobium sp. Y1814 TaxID=3418742 RepID=UPI003C1A8FBD